MFSATIRSWSLRRAVLAVLALSVLAGPGLAGSKFAPRRLLLIDVCRQDASGTWSQSLVFEVRRPLVGCLVNDGLDCTTDSCDPDLGCVHVANHEACDDGVFCNGAEQCHPEFGCVAISACPPAIDGCVILGGFCDEENDVCRDVADDSRCPDDGNPCTDEICDLGTRLCVSLPTECDDGVFCNGAEQCVPGVGCAAVSACPPAIDGCVIRNGQCDEENDVCLDVADDDLCPSGEPCTVGVCDVDTGDCSFVPACDSDDDCSSPCIIGACDDGCCVAISACPPTFGGCSNVTGCDEATGECVTENEPRGTPCDTATGSTLCGDNCNGVCNRGGTCRSSGAP